MSEDSQLAVSSSPDTNRNKPPGSTSSGSTDHYSEPDTESLDFLDEDLHTNDYSRAIGFIGKSSEIQWLRAVATTQPEQVDKEGSKLFNQRGLSTTGSPRVSSFAFWSDKEGVDVDFYVDPYEIPQLATAKHLVSSYMAKVHSTFPILDRKVFEEQFQEYFLAMQNRSGPRPTPKWQAILNLVFALGAKHSHLVKKDWRGDGNDHIIYQARARAFGLSKDMVTDCPDLSQIQALGLLSFYWLAVGQVSR
jgi:hypothetical protein